MDPGSLGARGAAAGLAGKARAEPAVGDEGSGGGVCRGEPGVTAADDCSMLDEVSEKWVDESGGEMCLVGDGAAIVACDLDKPGLVEQLVSVAREEEPQQAEDQRLWAVGVVGGPGERG